MSSLKENWHAPELMQLSERHLQGGLPPTADASKLGPDLQPPSGVCQQQPLHLQATHGPRQPFVVLTALLQLLAVYVQGTPQ
jgi:hypothetical protein